MMDKLLEICANESIVAMILIAVIAGIASATVGDDGGKIIVGAITAIAALARGAK